MNITWALSEKKFFPVIHSKHNMAQVNLKESIKRTTTTVHLQDTSDHSAWTCEVHVRMVHKLAN